MVIPNANHASNDDKYGGRSSYCAVLKVVNWSQSKVVSAKK